MNNILNFIKKNKYTLLLILLYGFLFVQMKNVFLFGDDFDVTYPMHAYKNGFMDIFRFCIDQVVYYWHEWSGRIVGHFIVSFGLSFFGINFFRFLNPIMVFLLVFLSLKILNFFAKFNFTKMMFFFSLLFISVNAYVARETLYWAYGGMLYIWGFVFLLTIVYHVYKYYLKNAEIPMFMIVIFVILSIIQVFMLEQLSFLLLSFYGIMLFIIKKQKKKNFSKILTLLIFTIVSFGIFLLAPGNVVRTDPLVYELAPFSAFQIVASKISVFFNFLFNPSVYGVYFSVFAMLVARKYISILTKNDKMIKKLPLLIFFSYFIIIFINNLFGLNLLVFFDDFDAFYLLGNHYSIFYVLFIDLYYILLAASIIYMFYKTISKKNKFLLLSFIISFVVSIIPVVCIRFNATRYFLFFFIELLLLIIYYILDLKEKSIDLKALLLLIAIVPVKFATSIASIILLLLFIFENFGSFVKKNCVVVSMSIAIMIMSFSFINLFVRYSKNAKLHIKNEAILSACRGWDGINLFELPYEDRLYSWHTIYMDYNNKDEFYSFYLGEFYESYYDIKADNIFIITKELEPYYVD